MRTASSRWPPSPTSTWRSRLTGSHRPWAERPVADGARRAHHRAMDTAALIDQYAAGPEAVHQALAGITDDELDRRPSGGGWTARQVVHHLADGETNSYIRLRRMLVDDGAELQAYDEAAWAAEPRLGYDGPIEPPLAVLRGGPGGEHGAPPAPGRRRLQPGRRPSGARGLLGADVAGDLRRARARPCRPDPPRPARRAIGLLVPGGMTGDAASEHGLVVCHRRRLQQPALTVRELGEELGRPTLVLGPRRAAG